MDQLFLDSLLKKTENIDDNELDSLLNSKMVKKFHVEKFVDNLSDIKFVKKDMESLCKSFELDVRKVNYFKKSHFTNRIHVYFQTIIFFLV